MARRPFDRLIVSTDASLRMAWPSGFNKRPDWNKEDWHRPRWRTIIKGKRVGPGQHQDHPPGFDLN